MKLAHLADLHLGFRQFERTSGNGSNLREDDVGRAFTDAISLLIERKPNVVVIAGDIFHASHPPNRSIILAFNQFARLKTALPECEIVVVAGNHDMPRSRENDPILRLYEHAGVRVVDYEAERLYLFDEALQILAVPDAPGMRRPALTPEPGSKYRVLLLHGEVAGVIPDHALERAAIEIPVGDLHAEEWNYIALGHYHAYHEVGRNAFYAGSIEYTATNFWSELENGVSTGKGFVIRDLDTGAHEFVQLKPQREVVDMPEFSVQGLGAEEIDERIRQVVDAVEGGIDGKIVRMRITHVPRGMMKDVDQKQVRSLKRRAFHFRLTTTKAEDEVTAAGLPRMIRGRRESLPDHLNTYFRSRDTNPDVSVDALVDLGLKYLDEAAVVVAEASST